MWDKLDNLFGIKHHEDFHAIHKRPALKKQLILVIIVHYLAIIFNAVSFVIAIPLFIYHMGILGIFPAVSIMVFVFRLALGRTECPATRIENNIRRELGLPEISTFVKHYILRRKR